MAQNTRRGTAARRAAGAFVHALGAACIRLQIPALPIADDDGEELGLRSPEFASHELAPAAVRRHADAAEVLIPADALEASLGVQGEGAVQAAVIAGSVVVIDDELFVLSGIQAVTTGGSECLYRLLLQQPATEVV